MKSYKLKDNHEFAERVAKLMNYADELGISIDYSCCSNRTWITDHKSGKEYELKDVEDGSPVQSFPAQTEYKIVYEDNE